jgi:hypothetical protein
MVSLLKKGALLAALAAVALLGGAGNAQAGFKLRLTEGNLVTTITGSGGGVGVTNLAFGNFWINFIGGISKPLIGGPNSAEMDIGTLTVRSTASGGTLKVELTDTDFQVGNGGPLLNVVSSITGITNGQISFQSWIDLGNTEFGHGATTGFQGPFTGVFGNKVEDLVAGGSGPFSITSQTTITLGPNATFESTDGHTTVTPSPAPAAVVLALTGLPMLGLGGVLRLRKRA